MKLYEVDSNCQTEISRQPTSDSTVQTTLVALIIFDRSAKGSEKTIKSLLEADSADHKKKSEPSKTNPFSIPAYVSIYTNMKLT